MERTLNPKHGTRNTEQEMKGKNSKPESVKIHAVDSKKLCVSPFPLCIPEHKTNSRYENLLYR